MVAAPPDPWEGVEQVNEFNYDNNVKLWVVVTNKGITGEFRAQISNAEGFPAGWRDYTRPIAWEESAESTLAIPPRTHARLRLGNLSRNPPCFWFYGPRDEMYTNNVHTIWQQNREFDGRVAFDLQIVNLASGALAVKRGEVQLRDLIDLPEFALA